MSEQPEPDSGYACDRAGTPWYHSGSRWFIRPGGEGRGWTDLAETYGPMTPLLPAVRPDGVPDDAVPFVGWVMPAPNDPGAFDIITPNGEDLDTYGAADLVASGLPVPAAFAPSLPERLRDVRRVLSSFDGRNSSITDGERTIRMSYIAEWCAEAADALEAGSQP